MTKQVVTFHYTLTDSKGDVIDSSRQGEPLAFLEGSGQIIPGLETALSKMEIGKEQKVQIPSKDAYGDYDKSLVFNVPKSDLPSQGVKLGDMFEVAEGANQRVVVVTAIKENEVTLDANHPMAGKDLSFSVEIVSRRNATPEELAHGHAHGEGGHHHH